MRLTDYQAKYVAAELTRRGPAGSVEQLDDVQSRLTQHATPLFAIRWTLV